MPDIAPIDTIEIVARADRPYPPANIKIAAEYFPDLFDGYVAVTWAHRDRLAQTAAPVAWTDGSIGPEAGVTYTLRFYNDVGFLVHTESGVSGASHTLSSAVEAANDAAGRRAVRRVDAISVRAGLESWQTFSHSFERAGLGVSLGKYLGGV